MLAPSVDVFCYCNRCDQRRRAVHYSMSPNSSWNGLSLQPNGEKKELERLHIGRDFVEGSSITITMLDHCKLVDDFHQMSLTRLIYSIQQDVDIFQ